ncbi:MAG TPA: TonB-dependent receptor [Candidatus Methylomirabilis sp.]|nr:TonB-dependent receptor [Candidatus Methylomirabilis sp.]
MLRIWKALATLFCGVLIGAAAGATVFGTVRGIVHDPQHRPIPDSEVTLKAKASDYTQTARTDANGEFHFDAVPLGEYVVTVSNPAFATEEEAVTVLSGAAPILHIALKLASQNESVTVTAEAAPGQTESVTPTTLVDRTQIQQTPGAMKTNSLAIITDYVPGAYFTHDQLHVRGGHQVSWLIDGVEIPNTNIASNLGPQVDPKDIDAVEMQRGSYAADFGDRTYGIFDVVPRTGFERDNEAEVVLSAGNFYQTDDQINFGGHTNRFAYYASANGNRTNLGLQTPTSAVLHDAANGYGGFVSLIYNASSQDQLRFAAQSRRDFYQVPFDSDNPDTAGQFLRDANRESDSFAAFSWVRTFSPGLVMTVSPFFHYNSADYDSDPSDFPSATTQNRASKYEGGQGTVSWIKGPNNARAGFYSFAQQDDQFFRVVYNDGSGTISPLSQNPDGSLIAVYVEDQVKVNSWLTLNGGFRQTHFSGGVVENASSPRVGASVRIPKLNWVFRGFYGYFYQAPPLGTLSGPALNDIQTQQQLDFVPLRGERDEEHQFGVTIPLKGWTLDADNFLTRGKNFFDHNSLNNSNVFFPVDVQGSRINGWELTLRSPRIRNRGQVYLTYSNQLALGFGCVIGGLIGSCATPAPGFFILDHDQRNTLHVGGQYTLPWRAYASTDVYYGSGFSNGNPAIPGDHLQPHTTFDLSLGKNFGERFSVNVQGLNVANRRVLLDNSFTFGGTHFLNPREIFVQLRYRFHY